MKVSPILILLALIPLSLPACDRMHAGEKEEPHQEHHKIVLTSPQAKDVVTTQQYVCQIHSQLKKTLKHQLADDAALFSAVA